MEENPLIPHAIVTCGPAMVPIDDVRRITNFSTGELGVLLTERLLEKGWRVTCFKGRGATYRDPVGLGLTLQKFDTNGDLLEGLMEVPSPDDVRFVFHAAALSDFEVDAIFGPGQEPLPEKKIPSFYEEVHLVLKPAFKLLPNLSELFPHAKVVGWKFELRGSRAEAITCAQAQLELNHSALCVLNGAAYGDGFGILDHQGLIAQVDTRSELAFWLTRWAGRLLASGGVQSC
ncbi:MAG: Phosphopantothenoylcysteine synthetase/decarboxylase [Verrucomicrobiota bacterium]|jgi:phosphopantothenoylcysteine synthetase/decarboxylase